MTSALSGSEKDRRLIRDLACQVAEIAALPAQAETRARWVKLNRLEPVRPMVWVNEIIRKSSAPAGEPRAVHGSGARWRWKWLKNTPEA